MKVHEHQGLNCTLEADQVSNLTCFPVPLRMQPPQMSDALHTVCCVILVAGGAGAGAGAGAGSSKVVGGVSKDLGALAAQRMDSEVNAVAGARDVVRSPHLGPPPY